MQVYRPGILAVNLPAGKRTCITKLRMAVFFRDFSDWVNEKKIYSVDNANLKCIL